jgi:hypothetical protein
MINKVGSFFLIRIDVKVNLKIPFIVSKKQTKTIHRKDAWIHRGTPISFLNSHVQGSCCPQEIKFNREDELGDLFNHMDG